MPQRASLENNNIDLLESSVFASEKQLRDTGEEKPLLKWMDSQLLRLRANETLVVIDPKHPVKDNKPQIPA